MLDDSGRTKRVNLIYLTNERMKRGLLILQNKNRKKETFHNEHMITQAFKQGLPIEITFFQNENHKTLQGRIFHIDRRNKKVLLISKLNPDSTTKLCTPIAFTQIICAKIIHTKLQ